MYFQLLFVQNDLHTNPSEADLAASEHAYRGLKCFLFLNKRSKFCGFSFFFFLLHRDLLTAIMRASGGITRIPQCTQCNPGSKKALNAATEDHMGSQKPKDGRI